MANYVTTQDSRINVCPTIKDLADSPTVTNLFEFAVPAGEAHVVRIIYNVTFKNATPNIQNHVGEVVITVINNAGTLDITLADTDEYTSKSTGTLTDMWTATAGTAKVTVAIEPNSSLAAPTTYNIRYGIRSMTNPQVTYL